MNLYTYIRPLLFALDPETAHHCVIQLLKLYGKLHAPHTHTSNSIEVMGLKFPNRVGIAAGFDKNAEAIDGLNALGFGFIEVGTLTPKPQSGNPKPRLFRFAQTQALINRMGFNNCGIEQGIKNIQRQKYRGILGINIGKNEKTPIENAQDDYLIGLRTVYPYASYIAINISSPNTEKLRILQQGEALENLLSALKNEQKKLEEQHRHYVPLVIKLAPDLTDEKLLQAAQMFLYHRIDGVIATNTTLSRKNVENFPYAKEPGGLSGAPLTDLSTSIIQKLHAHLGEKIPIIASGGILSVADAHAKMAAGAKLIQLYTGLVYQGHRLISQCIDSCV